MRRYTEEEYMEEEPTLVSSAVVKWWKETGSSDVKLMMFLMENHSDGKPFKNTIKYRRVIAKDLNCSLKSVERSFPKLLKSEFLYMLEKNKYAVSARCVFNGPPEERIKYLKLEDDVRSVQSNHSSRY